MPPAPLDASSVARKALSLAMRALTRGQGAEALMSGRGEILPVYLERARQWRRNLGLAEDYVSTFADGAATEGTETAP